MIVILITNPSSKFNIQVLSQYTDKLDEINKLKDSAVEKEHLLKDSETKVANLQNQISEITKMSEEKQNSDSIANNGSVFQFYS